MNTCRMALNLNEMELVTGAMTQEEREAAVQADDNDSFLESTGKFIMRPVVKGLDAIGNALSPLNEKLDPISPERIRDTTKAAVKLAWETFKSWF